MCLFVLIKAASRFRPASRSHLGARATVTTAWNAVRFCAVLCAALSLS